MHTKTVLLGLALAGLLPAQVTDFAVSPTIVNYAIRSPLIYPGWRYVAPPKRILTIQAASGQAWTVTVTGRLKSACLYAETCFQITEEYSGKPISSGTGPMRVAVNWYGSQAPGLTPGTYTGTVTFASGAKKASVTVSLAVSAASSLPAVSEVKATALAETGCTSSDTSLSYSYKVRCDIPNEAPMASPALTQPAVGKSFVDPVFGGKITRITGPGCATEYGTTTAFSVNSTYTWNSCGVYRTSNAMLVRGPHANIVDTTMSATDDEVYYYFDGPRIRRYNFVTDEDIILADYRTPPYNFQKIYSGGTAAASEDDWIAFYEYKSGPFPRICAVDLVALRAAGGPRGDNTFCTVFKGTQPLTFLDWASVSETDSTTLKRYVYLSSVPLSVVFSVGAPGSGALSQEYVVPEWPGWTKNNDDGVCLPAEICYNANNFTHNALFRDRDGQVLMFANFEDILQNRNYVSTYRLSAGLQILRPEAEGGGLKLLGRLELDNQPGCSSRIAGCSVASIERGHRFAARVTQAVGGADKTTLTLSADTGWQPRSLHPVRVQNGAGSWSCLNGGWTATVLAGNMVEIPALCTSAKGALDRVLLGDAAQPFTGADNDNRGQIQIWRPERQVHRIAMHRSVVWTDVPGTGISSYETTPRASISRDGRFVAFTSNWGALDFEGASVYIAETGLGAPENEIAVRDFAPDASGATLVYDVPGGQACTQELSADPTFQNLLETFTDPAGPVSRLISVGRTAELQPATNYWLRMQCGMEVESRAFRTLDAFSFFTRTVVTDVAPAHDGLAADAVVEYRTAGAGTFSATAPQTCADGCQVSWPGLAGSVSEYRILYRNSQADVTSSTDIYTITVPR